MPNGPHIDISLDEELEIERIPHLDGRVLKLSCNFTHR